MTILGSSITWFGCPSDSLSQLRPSKVAYTIDGVKYTTTASNTLILFDAKLKHGTHKIDVTKQGSPAEIPLTGYAVDSSGSSNGTPSARQNTSLPEPDTPSTSSMQKLQEAELIVGATLTGIALSFLLSFIAQWYKQRRRRRLVKLCSEECGRA